MNVSGKKIGLGVVALAVGLMGSVAVADMAQSKTRMGGFLGALFGGIGPNFDFTAADANQDGNVSPEELAAYRAARLTAIDANNDGIVSTEELTASQSAAEAERAARKAARLVADLDADADGQLSTAELLAKPVPPEAFGRADTNADGVIDQTEATTAAERPQGHDGHRGHRGHPEQGAGAEPAAPAN
jgi:Ca2+-binding EF-hand superfamily protein